MYAWKTWCVLMWCSLRLAKKPLIVSITISSGQIRALWFQRLNKKVDFRSYLYDRKQDNRCRTNSLNSCLYTTVLFRGSVLGDNIALLLSHENLKTLRKRMEIWSFYTIDCVQTKLGWMFRKQKLFCLGIQRKGLIII